MTVTIIECQWLLIPFSSGKTIWGGTNVMTQNTNRIKTANRELHLIDIENGLGKTRTSW